MPPDVERGGVDAEGQIQMELDPGSTRSRREVLHLLVGDELGVEVETTGGRIELLGRDLFPRRPEIPQRPRPFLPGSPLSVVHSAEGGVGRQIRFPALQLVETPAAALRGVLEEVIRQRLPHRPSPGPLGPGHRILRRHVDCSPCFLRECPLDFRCMQAIVDTLQNGTSADFKGEVYQCRLVKPFVNPGTVCVVAVEPKAIGVWAAAPT